MNVLKQAGVRHELPEPSARARATRTGGQGCRLRKGNRGRIEEVDVFLAFACGRPVAAGWALDFPSHECAVGVTKQQQPREKGNKVKTLNPSIERLDERVAPDLMGSIGIGVIIGIGGQVGVAGPGNGTSCYTNSDSSGCNSSPSTNSGTCHCWRHSH